jgi:hypothetical protein
MRMLRPRLVFAKLGALLVCGSAVAGDLTGVARRFLERHGVPCQSVLKIGSPQDLGEIATCDDGREWALFWIEDEIAFVHPLTREAYRWDREIYLAHPELYGSIQSMVSTAPHTATPVRASEPSAAPSASSRAKPSSSR